MVDLGLYPNAVLNMSANAAYRSAAIPTASVAAFDTGAAAIKRRVANAASAEPPQRSHAAMCYSGADRVGVGVGHVATVAVGVVEVGLVFALGGRLSSLEHSASPPYAPQALALRRIAA